MSAMSTELLMQTTPDIQLRTPITKNGKKVVFVTEDARDEIRALRRRRRSLSNHLQHEREIPNDERLDMEHEIRIIDAEVEKIREQFLKYPVIPDYMHHMMSGKETVPQRTVGRGVRRDVRRKLTFEDWSEESNEVGSNPEPHFNSADITDRADGDADCSWFSFADVDAAIQIEALESVVNLLDSELFESMIVDDNGYNMSGIIEISPSHSPIKIHDMPSPESDDDDVPHAEPQEFQHVATNETSHIETENRRRSMGKNTTRRVSPPSDNHGSLSRPRSDASPGPVRQTTSKSSPHRRKKSPASHAGMPTKTLTIGCKSTPSDGRTVRKAPRQARVTPSKEFSQMHEKSAVVPNHVGLRNSIQFAIKDTLKQTFDKQIQQKQNRMRLLSCAANNLQQLEESIKSLSPIRQHTFTSPRRPTPPPAVAPDVVTPEVKPNPIPLARSTPNSDHHMAAATAASQFSSAHRLANQ